MHVFIKGSDGKQLQVRGFNQHEAPDGAADTAQSVPEVQVEPV